MQSFKRYRRQHTEFIMAIQPVALCPLLTGPARRVLRIEITILWALTDLQISQQEYAWVSKCLYDLSSHDFILRSGTGPWEKAGSSSNVSPVM